MKQVLYVVAFLNLGEGELKQTLIAASSGLDAMNKVTNWNCDSEDDVYDLAANCDCYINYIQV